MDAAVQRSNPACLMVTLLGAWQSFPAAQRVFAGGELTLTHAPLEQRAFRAALTRYRPAWLLFGEDVAEDTALLLIAIARKTLPDTKLAVLCPEEDFGRCERWARRGALVCLDPPSSPERLLPALNDATKLDLAVQAGCFQRRWLLRRAELEAIARLTSQEERVLALLGTGCTNAQIAAELTLAESTIQSHLRNLFQKLGVTNRTEAANAAKILGL